MFIKINPTKESIIKTLANNWPLSITEIQQNSHTKTSYQYLRQCIKELHKENVIVKRGRKYELSTVWLQQTARFARKTLEHYNFGIKNNILTKETTQIRLHSLEELGNFMLEALERNFLEEDDNQGFFCFLNHLWIPFSNKEKQNRILAIKEKLNIAYTKNDALDKILHKICYKKKADVVKYVRQELDYDFFVYNDCTIQIYLPQQLLTLMDKLYANIGNPFRKIAHLFAMTYKEFPINILITRNKDIANTHRDKVKRSIKQ